MQKKFLTGLFILLGVNLIVKPIWIFGIDRTVQNITGPSEYGLYFAILNFSFLFNIFLDLGITNFNNRNIAQNEHLLSKYFSGISILKFLLAGFYVVLTFGTAYFIGYDSRQFHFLLFMTINQFLLSFILYLRSNISGLQLFKTDSILSVTDRFLMIIFCSVLIWGNWFASPFRIEWFLYAQTLAYAITFLICIAIVSIRSHFQKPCWDIPFFIRILKDSFPFALLILLMTFYNRIDSVMLERMLDNGNHFAGVYAAAYRLLDAFNMVSYLFAVILLPLFSRMLKLRENIIPIVRISFNMLFVFSTFIALFSAFHAEKIMSILYHANTIESAAVFRILMFCLIPISITYIFGTLLTANGSLKKLNIIAFAGMILNIILNIIFIPIFKTEGAAAVSLATQILTALFQLIYVLIIFKIKNESRYIILLGLYLIVSISAIYLCQYFIDNILISLLVSGSICLISASMLQILKPWKLFSLMKESRE